MAYIFLILGLFFLWLEFYLPGGAFAVASAIFIFAALATFFSTSTSVVATTLFFVACCIGIFATIRIAISRIKKSANKDTFFLSKDQEGYTAQDLHADIIGKQGVTTTECGPSGYGLIDGRRYPIICRGPYLDKGTQIEVIGKELGNYIVRSK